jgi:hypothetical protein
MTNIVLVMLIIPVVLAGMSACLEGGTVWAASNLLSPKSQTSASHSGPVIQEQVNTGNVDLDKQISKFYSCISKTHQDPPTIQVVDSCYSQQQIAGATGPGTSTHNPNNIETHSFDTSHNPNNIETHSFDTSPRSSTVSPPPGVLVEVP